MRWGAVTAAVLFTAVSIGCDAAKDDHFRVIADVGYHMNQFQSVHENKYLIVPKGRDCLLEPQSLPNGDGGTEWVCAVRGECKKGGIAVISRAFPYDAKLEYYRFLKPRHTDVTICNGNNVRMEKPANDYGVYFTEKPGSSQILPQGAFFRIRPEEDEEIVKAMPKQRKDYKPHQVTIRFDKHEEGPSFFGSSTYKKTGGVPRPTVLPMYPPQSWKIDAEGNLEKTDEVFGNGGGLCVSVLSYKGTTLDFKITRVMDRSNALRCPAFIIAAGKGKLEKPFVRSPRFVFPSGVAWQLQDGVFGKRIKTTESDSRM